jgi:hypothetical protein
MSNPGFYNGRHFTTYVDQVKQLKKDNQLEKAELLLIYLVGATESEDRVDKRGVAPWYYEQLALICRKNKDLVKEHEILERFESQRHAPGRKPEILIARLAKVRELLQTP